MIQKSKFENDNGHIASIFQLDISFAKHIF